MLTPAAARGGATGRVLFVAREPDETLRTFLPVIDCLRERHGLASRVLFHHTPGEWARHELARRCVGTREVPLPDRGLGWAFLAHGGGSSSAARTVDEICRFWRARRLARNLLDCERPSAVVVIQDTLLLERFLVRQANRLGLPTIVIQWAFSFPQALYDRLRSIQYAQSQNDPGSAPSTLRRSLRPLTRATYRAILAGLGLSFDLVNSYGGGEARIFAVMGEAFKEQYLAQGVRNKRVVVTGHPAHDAAHARATSPSEGERRATRERYGLPLDRPLVLYATQPVLWRRVIGPAELRANVTAIADAVARAPGMPQLVLKLHPRERPEDYAFCEQLTPPVRLISRADMADLIAASDAFISSSSSTVLLAMMLARPIVTINFNQVPHFDFFESIGGTLHTRTPDEFGQAIELALGDEPTRKRLAQEQQAVLARYAMFDGDATERVAGLIVEAIAESGKLAGAA